MCNRHKSRIGNVHNIFNYFIRTRNDLSWHFIYYRIHICSTIGCLGNNNILHSVLFVFRIYIFNSFHFRDFLFSRENRQWNCNCTCAKHNTTCSGT